MEQYISFIVSCLASFLFFKVLEYRNLYKEYENLYQEFKKLHAETLSLVVNNPESSRIIRDYDARIDKMTVPELIVERDRIKKIKEKLET